MTRRPLTNDEREAARARELQRRANVATVELPARQAPARSRTPRGWGVLPGWIACDPSLSPEARVVALAISCHYNEATGSAYPSIGTLAGYLGRSERTIMRAIDELARRGLVERRYRFVGGRQTSTAYLLRFDRWGDDGGEGVTRDTLGGDTRDTHGGDTGGTPRTGPQEPDPTKDDPPYPPQAGGQVERSPAGRRTDPASVYAREHRVPVAVARATLERDERHAKWRDAVRVVTLGLDLSTLQAVDLLENAGRLPTDDDVRRYLREEGKAAPGRLHGPTLWEPSAIYPWMQLLAADLHEEERTPNAWMENRPRGYWLGVLLRRLQDAA